MPDTITESIANIVSALVQGQRPKISASELRLLGRVAAGNREATLALGGITAVLAASDVIERIPTPGLGPIFPEFGQGDGPVPITPGPYPPDLPQPIKPGPPDNPSGPQPIDTSVTHPWFEQVVRYVVLEEFLVPAELETISQYALDNEERFQPSQVVVPGETSGSVDFTSRRSKVLTDVGNLGDMFRDRVRRVLPLVGQRLGMDTRNAGEIDVQMTASNDEEFFVAHTDAGPTFQTRAITYVYFFHREPAEFTGGELRLFENKALAGGEQAPSRFTTIVPFQNQVVFFPSTLLHEVSPLAVPSREFRDSRFTMNGWIHV